MRGRWIRKHKIIKSLYVSISPPLPDHHQSLGLRPLRRGQVEVEGQEPPHPGANAVVGGTPGRGTGLLARHDALPA